MKRCTFCGGTRPFWGTDGRVHLCISCARRVPFRLRGRLAALLEELRGLGVQAFIRLDVGEETDDG